MAGVSAGHSVVPWECLLTTPGGILHKRTSRPRPYGVASVCGTWSLSLCLSTGSTRGASDLTKIARLKAQGSRLKSQAKSSTLLSKVLLEP
jgi:hypothetical protein